MIDPFWFLDNFMNRINYLPTTKPIVKENPKPNDNTPEKDKKKKE